MTSSHRGSGNGGKANVALDREMLRTARPVGQVYIFHVKGALATIPSAPLRNSGYQQHPGTRIAFYKASRNLSVRCRVQANPNPNLDWSHCLPPAAPNPSQRACREEHALLIVQMSSGRLFLDRVARQHCPSPLHRQSDHKPLDRSKETNYHRTGTVAFTRVSAKGGTPRCCAARSWTCRK